MADTTDLEERMAKHREWITSDGPHAYGIRMYDGIVELLIEAIGELRDLNATRRETTPDA